MNVISHRELALHVTRLECDKGATLTTDSILLSALATAIHAHVSEEQRRSAATSSAEAASVNADRSLRSSKLSANEDQHIVVADIKGLLERMHSVYHASIKSMVQSICRICHMLQDKIDGSAGDGTARTGYCVYMGEGGRPRRDYEDNDVDQQA